MEHRRPIDILLVEDNADHAALTMRALRDGNMLNEIFWVKDGQEAVDFLDHAGRYAAVQPPRPGLILLDIRLPKLDGHEVLRHIKSLKLYWIMVNHLPEAPAARPAMSAASATV